MSPLKLETHHYICFNNFVIFFPLQRRRCFKVEVTTRELNFPTRLCSAQGLARTLTHTALNSTNWIQMALFVQGRHQHEHGSVARVMIVRGREGAPCSEVTATRLLVSRVCGPIAPDTPVPLDGENGDTLRLIVGSITSSLVTKKKQALCQPSPYKCWERAKDCNCKINSVIT